MLYKSYLGAALTALFFLTFASASAIAETDVIAPTGFITMGSGGSVTAADDAAAKIVTENRCTDCHGMSYITGRHYTEATWDTSISRMEAKGMSLTATERSQILGYLVRHHGIEEWSPGAPFSNTLLMTANLSASDIGGSGLSEMRLSNDGVFDDTSGVEGWRPFGATFGWTLLAGDGSKTVSAQFRDAAGNVSGTVSDKVVLDTTLPTASMRGLTALTTVSSRSTVFPVAWSGADSASGIAVYDVQYKIGATGAWKAFRTGVSFTGAKLTGIAGSSYYLRARAKDKAGNLGAYSAAGKTVLPYDERSGKYSAGWLSVNSSSKPYFMKTAKSTKKAKASATFKLTGRRFTLIVTKGPKNGKANVYVDGVLKKTIDTKASSVKYRQSITVASFTSVSKHTVKVVNKATAGRPNLVLDGMAAER